jgi:hypothetical protein
MGTDFFLAHEEIFLPPVQNKAFVVFPGFAFIFFAVSLTPKRGKAGIEILRLYIELRLDYRIVFMYPWASK